MKFNEAIQNLISEDSKAKIIQRLEYNEVRQKLFVTLKVFTNTPARYQDVSAAVVDMDSAKTRINVYAQKLYPEILIDSFLNFRDVTIEATYSRTVIEISSTMVLAKVSQEAADAIKLKYPNTY